MQVDAHQHYWKLDRGDYGWLTPQLGILYRDYLPEDLSSELKVCQINKTVVVQAAPTLAETEYLLAMCEQEETLAGVVGWLDLESDQFESDFLRLQSNPYFVGVRPMLQDLEDDAFILRPRVLKSLELISKYEFPIDLLVMPRHLPNIIKLFHQVPNLKAVINHLAKPDIKGGVIEPWRMHMQQISAFPNVYCKLSGMVTEADLVAWRAEDFKPFVHHIIASFGVDRLMYGSDWPVCKRAAEYNEVYQLIYSVLPEAFSEADKSKLFGKNAIEFYKLQV